MKENNYSQDALEQRLHAHYEQHYGPLPSANTIWTRVQPELDQQSASSPLLTPRSSRFHLLANRFTAFRRRMFARQTNEQYMSDEFALQANGIKHAQGKRSRKHRLIRAGEVALAAIVVVSLLLGWLAVTRWNALGNGPDLYTYASTPGEFISDLQWMPDSKHLMFAVYTQASNHYRYFVWDASTGKTRQTLDISLPAALIGRVIVDAPNGRYALIRNDESNGKTWTLTLADILTGQSRRIYQATYQGKDAPNASAVFSTDSKYLAFIGEDARIYLWNIASGKIMQVTNPVTTSPGSANGQWLMWSLDDQRIIARSTSIEPAQVQMWSTQTGQRLLKIVSTPSLELFYWSPASGNLGGLSLDGKRILTYNKQTGMFVERASQTLQILHTFAMQVGIPGQIWTRGQPLWVANDTRILFLGDRTASSWNSATGKLLSTNSLKDDPQTSGINLYPSVAGGRYIAFGEAGNLVAIWDLVTNKKVTSIMPANGLENGVSWSEDGKYVDVEGAAEHGQIYNALTGKLIVNYQGDFALLSPDSRYIATKEQSSLQTLVRILPVG